MKQLNGTITLSFLEEDNQQRVIFRVVPLCTKESVAFSTSAFPDVGSLRVVPDKREQSTFKERMRSMGSLCAIQLLSDGKELTKVRQNRNYDPAQGEVNQYAIYSDVICEFGADGALEVFESATEAAASLTPHVLLLRNKVLYGPIERDEAAAVVPDALKPFGNDSFLLQTITLPDGSKHQIYWNPDATVNWRQRRGSLRRVKARDEAEAEAPAEIAPAKPREPKPPRQPRQAEPPKQVKPAEAAKAIEPPKPIVRTAEPVKAAEPVKPRENARVKNGVCARDKQLCVQPADDPQPVDTALPIGTKLEILDSEISFDEQISQIEQPLSETANRLASALEPEPEEHTPVKFTGTPLVRGIVAATRDFGGAEPLHQVVDQQIRTEKPSEEQIENPIETLQGVLRRIWQSPDTLERAMEMLTHDEAFQDAYMGRMQQHGRTIRAVEAAQAQLDDIEAERLHLLMQLDQAKTDRRQNEEATLAAISQKRRATVDALQADIDRLQADQAALRETVASLADTACTEAERLARGATLLAAVDSETLTLSPTLGVKQSVEAMIESVRLAENARGFACSEDDATEATLLFALFDRITVRSASVTDADAYARTLLYALGLQDVSARTDGALTIVSALPADGLRTPTVRLGQRELPELLAFGHKTILLLGKEDPCPENSPVLVTPLLTGLPRQTTPKLSPTALASFQSLRESVHAMPDTGERWFTDFGAALADAGASVPDAVMQDMRLFAAIASRKLRGGFAAAADSTFLSWVAPRIGRLDAAKLRGCADGLPRAMRLLGIE